MASVPASVSNGISGTVTFHSTRERTLWHCVPGHRHQPARHSGLCDDAVLLRLLLHAGAGEAGEVWWPPAVLCHRVAHQVSQASWELRLSAGAQWAPASPDLGGHAVLHPRGHHHSHHEQQLPGVCFLPAVVKKKILDTPGQYWEAQEELLPSGR